MEKIILNHINKYRKMEMIDLIKLIYQSEFGGGHLISNPEAAFNYLKNEYNSIKQDETKELYEDIGCGIVRVNLAALNKNNLSIERLNELFVLSANNHKGSVEGFEKKIDIVIKLLKEDKLPFKYEDFINLINEYRKLNYPMVSHSKTYNEYYHPSYRIILLKYL